MPATNRKETAKKRIRRTRDGRGCATSESILCTHPPSPAMIADGEPDGLFDYQLDFGCYYCCLLRVGASRLGWVWLEAVGPALYCCAASARLRAASLYPNRTVCDDYSAVFSPPSAVGLAQRSDGAGRSCRLAAA